MLSRVIGLLAAEWAWLFVSLLYVLPAPAGLVIGWIAFRRRGWKALLVTSAVWSALWFVVWLALPGNSALEATAIVVWLFLAPCLVGGALAALARRVAGGGRVLG
jgi:hypothetical protein